MKFKRIYLIILVLSIISSLFVVYNRINVETPYKTYEMVMDYTDVKNFADAVGKTPVDVAREFMDVGISSFAINENTIDSLTVNQNYNISLDYRGLDLYITGEKEILDYIKSGIQDVTSQDNKIYFLDDDTLVIEGKLSDFAYGSNDVIRDFTSKRVGVARTSQSIYEYVGLGYLEDELHMLKENDIPFNLRPSFIGSIQDSKKAIDRYFGYAQKYMGNQNLIIFSGEELLGGEKGIEYLSEKINKSDMLPVAIETSEQDGNTDLPGIKKLAKLVDYRFTRLFSTLTYIQDRFDYQIAGHHNGQEIINSYYRAITERNVRAIYFKVFRPKNGNLVTDMEVYKARIGELNQRLAKHHGIYPVSKDSSINAMKNFEVGKLVQILAMFGVMASGLVVFDNAFDKMDKLQYALLIIGVVGILAVSTTSKFKALATVFGLLSTITFSSMAVTRLLCTVKKANDTRHKESMSIYVQFLGACKVLLQCVLISMTGTLFLATLYGHSEYLLEFSKFSGVKVSQLAPLVITVISYLGIIGVGKLYDKDKSMMEQVKMLSMSNIKVWQAALVFVMLGALAVMLLRSGHSNNNVEPSSIEILMRNVFEYIFPARPRNKAIFVGYPALLVLMVFAYKNKYKVVYPILALAATIGQTDILNTFSHIRTPYVLSVKRVAIEYIFAVVMSFVIVMICHWTYLFIQKRN